MNKRRDYGTGGLRQKPTGSWEASYRHNGKRLTRNFPARREAQSWLREVGHEAQTGTLVTPERMTVEEYLTRWLSAIQSSVRPKTYQSYESLCRWHFFPAFGALQLTQLQPLAIQELWRQKLDGGLATGTVRYLHAVLRRALAMAVRWQLLARNPTDYVEPPRVTRATFTVWTEVEVRTFLATMRGHRLFALYLLALATGMRKGEILGLQWDDIDWPGHTLHVRRQVCVFGGRIQVSEPKTAKSRRAVAVPDVVMDALSERRALGEDALWVFAARNGEMMWPDVLTRQFQSLARRAGLPVIRFHDLRHTAATLMLGRGVHPKIVSEMLGHSGVGMTLDIYSHVLPTMQQQAALTMQSLLS